MNTFTKEELSKAVADAVAEALAQQEADRIAAADPETIRRKNWESIYTSHAPVIKPEKTIWEKTRETAEAWKNGERWPSDSLHPSMDYDAMIKAREGANNE